ncbi:hypothetical protein LTR84_006613 [Exophiala bonariae]|uniref:Uncharacterized protein n=1 Tax=Exophiala bonariae TaxID=1690606 RepID=A0AAV9N0J8_9EURO|nr:hypothetical protein LTR84_006613 [Exophiala bonariae]
MSFNNGMDMSSGTSVHPSDEGNAELRLRQFERTASRTQHELKTLISVRSQTPMSQVESVTKEREIRELQARLQEQEQEVQRMRAELERQRVTIATQSKAIQQPYGTPGHGQGHHQAASFYGQGGRPPYPPPPAPLLGPHSGPGQQQPKPTPPSGLAYQPPTGPRGASQFGYGQQQWNNPGYQTNQTLPPPPQPQFGQHTTVNPFGSPEPRPQSNRSGFQPNSKHSSHSSRSNPPSDPRRSKVMQGNQFTPSPQHARQPHQTPQIQGHQPPSHPSYPQNQPLSLPAPLVDTGSVGGGNVGQFKSTFENVVNMTQKYAFAHVNTPSTIKDKEMPQAIKDRLMNASTMTTAFQYMSSPYTRFFLVTKVMIQWILRNILVHDCFRGLDAIVDKAIDDMKNQIYQTTPAQVKFQLLNSIAMEIFKLKQRPDFENFLQTRARQRGNELWAILKPMMHQKTSRDWDDLLVLMIEAHRAAAYMFTGAEEYRFDLPNCGALYVPETMLTRDIFPNVKSEQQLVAERAQVRLAITPHLTVRSSDSEGHVISSTVVPASVLLKVGH